MMRLETERLLLRPYVEEDLDGFYACVSDPEVVRYEPYRPMSRDEARQALESRLGNEDFWALERKADGTYVGNLYLGRRDFQSMELGYVLARGHWGRGYAWEGCQALMKAAFRQGAHRIYAECDPQNQASWRLLERLGMLWEAHLRQNVYFWTDERGFPLWKDTYVYALLNPDEGAERL